MGSIPIRGFMESAFDTPMFQGPCIVKMSQPELEWLLQLARTRTDNNVGAHVVNKRQQGLLDTSYMNLLGEHAVSKYIGVPINAKLNVDGTHNLMYKNKQIVVKYTKYAGGVLFFKSFAKFQADVAVLTTPVKNTSHVRIAGWISKSEFGAQMQTKDFGYGPMLYVGQQALHHIDTLKRRIDS